MWRPLPLATVRAIHMVTARSRRRGLPRHGGEGRRRRNYGPKARPRLQGQGARVLGCTPTRGRRSPHGRARERARDVNATRTHRHGEAATKTGRFPTARGGWLGRRRARVDEGSGTYKKMRPSLARWPASPAAARSGGRSASARRPWRPQEGRNDVLTSVASGRSGARR
jgi:hypothetical protein